jgi:hypothetical protein
MDEQIEEKKAISSITNMLAEDPELIRNVVNEIRARTEGKRLQVNSGKG